ncbi:hypothetical protein [Nostoc parmelioides]|uniref:30S ribosomal protein S27ae n=1 Tax=Nostoc parmelioides FACHB-3921 TaxID=2692909 RepID=A0ABR8BN15_9NOSO|nr:hypothetical protein [Nostoc parmelioides]MBD2254632.1 hypothetical protein [Nostoc parmelioides FACHB-3921]
MKPKNKKIKEKPQHKCSSCGHELTLPKGYEDTGLCGVCATGSSAMLDEFGESW